MASPDKSLRAALRYTCVVCNRVWLTELLPMKEIVSLLEAEGIRHSGRSKVPHPEGCGCITPERISFSGIGPNDVTYGLVGAYNVELIFDGPYTKHLFAPAKVETSSSATAETIMIGDVLEEEDVEPLDFAHPNVNFVARPHYDIGDGATFVAVR